jgi:lipoprotein-releasing system permease protein
MGDGVLLPKGFRDHGARIGDKGIISYESPSMSMNQQKQIPIYVAGFYDQGIMALGGKFVLAPREIASLVRTQTNADLLPQSNGVHVRFLDYQKAPKLKEAIVASLEKRGLTPYFQVESYDEYDFIRPFLQELHSQKNLFSILAGIIIIVACSNIISMLIILVNDKKKEIGILRSMGATTLSIASIFGFAGLMMGLIGSLVGIGAALFTLDHLSSIIKLLGHLQGHAAFGSLFFGDRLPSELSFEALRFVLIATSITSLLSGLVPAIKACLVKPAATLRSE